MELNFNIYSLIIFLGAVQGFVLFFSMIKRKPKPSASLWFFLLFLFSLAYNNLFFAFLDIDLYRHFRALHSFPYPAKWLIGPAAFYYVFFQFTSYSKAFKKQLLLSLFPAFIFGLLLLYGFIVATVEGSYRVIGMMVQNHVFRISELLSLSYTIFFLWKGFRLIKKEQSRPELRQRHRPHFKWLFQFVIAFLFVNVFNLGIVITDLGLHNFQETRTWYYFVDISYTLFIYWIGFSGFTRAKVMFNTFYRKLDGMGNGQMTNLILQLKEMMEQDKLYRQANLNLNEVAQLLQCNPKQLSKLINEEFGQNFSDYINQYRIKEVKQKLHLKEYDHYTILAIAMDAGFNSKSSFNAVFKKSTGLTPRAFRSAPRFNN